MTDTRTLTGRLVSGLVVLFMLFDGITKLIGIAPVTRAMAELGWPPGQTPILGIVILFCTALYTLPRTTIAGAILLTAFLGGATAAKARIEDPSLVFSCAMGILVWLGVYLREPRLRALVLR